MRRTAGRPPGPAGPPPARRTRPTGPAAGIRHRRDAGQRTLPLARVVREAPTLDGAAGHPDRQLVGDHRPPRGREPRPGRRPQRPACGPRSGVGLAPRRTPRLAQVPPDAGVPERPVAHPEGLALELVAASTTRSSMTGSSPNALAVGSAVSCARSSGDDTRCLMSRPPNHCAARSAIRRPELGQVVVGQPAVQHPGRVVHLAVPQQVHHGDRLVGADAARPRQQARLRCARCGVGAGSGGHGAPSPGTSGRAAAAARAACGRAVATRSSAASSCAALTNHASKALGRQRHPVRQHGVEERAEAVQCLGLGIREVGHRRPSRAGCRRRRTR